MTEALRANAGAISVIFVTEDARTQLQDLASLAEQRKVVVESRSAAELDAFAKGDRHQGVVAITGEYSYLSLEELLSERPDDALIVALDEITDPHNFGAIVRSAVALGAHGLITLKHRAAPVTPVVVRASAGATEHARIARVSNLAQTIERLVEDGFSALGLAAEGSIDIAAARSDGPTLLVVGSEGHGLRRLVRERCTALVHIPMAGPIESLNASVAAGIALYVLRSAQP